MRKVWRSYGTNHAPFNLKQDLETCSLPAGNANFFRSPYRLTPRIKFLKLHHISRSYVKDFHHVTVKYLAAFATLNATIVNSFRISRELKG